MKLFRQSNRVNLAVHPLRRKAAHRERRRRPYGSKPEEGKSRLNKRLVKQQAVMAGIGSRFAALFGDEAEPEEPETQPEGAKASRETQQQQPSQQASQAQQQQKQSKSSTSVSKGSEKGSQQAQAKKQQASQDGTSAVSDDTTNNEQQQQQEDTADATVPVEPSKPAMTLEEYEASKEHSGSVAISQTSEKRAVEMDPSELQSLKLSRGKAIDETDSDPALSVSSRKTVGANKLHRGGGSGKNQQEKVVTAISATNTSSQEALSGSGGRGSGRGRSVGRGASGSGRGRGSGRSAGRGGPSNQTPVPQDESAFPALGK